jgi:hypothetical protein
MAELGGHKELYEYMYRATSSWVHFSPNILLRLGWTNGPTERALYSETIYSFTTKHFSGYYEAFNRHYSVYLLGLLIEKFITSFRAHDRQKVLALRRELSRQQDLDLRWPEVVTPEEMNLKPPSQIILLLARSIAEREGGKFPPDGHERAMAAASLLGPRDR